MFKKLLIGVVVILIVAGGGFFYLASNLDMIVKAAIEKVGTQAAQAETTLTRVRIALTSGEGGLYGFKMANPKGFATDSAMKIGDISIKIDTNSLPGTGPIVIREIKIDDPQLTYEIAENGKSNLQTIQKNIEAFTAKMTGGAKSGAAKQEAKAEKPAEPGRKFFVDRLAINGGEVRLSHKLVGGQNPIAVKLPNVELTNLGRDGGGLSGEALGRLILDKLSSMAIETGGAALVKQLRDQGVQSLKGAVEQSDVGKSVGKAINGLFGK